jgi:hypothetical protein
MENEINILFVGGPLNGQMKVSKTKEGRLNSYDTYYLLKGEIETKKYGRIHIYALENMNSSEEERLIEKIKAL